MVKTDRPVRRLRYYTEHVFVWAVAAVAFAFGQWLAGVGLVALSVAWALLIGNRYWEWHQFHCYDCGWIGWTAENEYRPCPRCDAWFLTQIRRHPRPGWNEETWVQSHRGEGTHQS